MSAQTAWLTWETDGRLWPHRDTSRFVTTGRYRWHVQLAGPEGAPAFLLLHGTGAASFSWRALLPLLSRRYRVIVPDLPSHGFSRPQGPADLSLEGMTAAVGGLLRNLEVKPHYILGHSAGAVIGLSLVEALRRLDADTPQMVFSVNGALKPIRGNRLLSPMAKALFANPLSASMFAGLARSTPLGGNLLTATGSPIDAEGEAIYRRLLGASGHVRGALGMMASWDLERLPALLRRLSVPLALLAARDDPMVPASSSETAATVCRVSSLTLSETGGHLLHECDPDRVLGWIEDSLGNHRSNGVDAA